MEKKVTVGISDLKIVKEPDMLISYALGSCVGICLYDKVNKIAGMSHILLPCSSIDKQVTNIMKFADTAIRELYKQMLARGCNRAFITAKIAGGANMFEWEGETIGDKNIKAVISELGNLGIPVIAKDVGGNYGRTVSIDAKDGSVIISALSKGIKTI